MMLLPRAVRVYVATAPCNLRKSFGRLSAGGPRRTPRANWSGCHTSLPQAPRSRQVLRDHGAERPCRTVGGEAAAATVGVV